ncbi:MAG: formylglycine-generating enzyme family protein [Planctomycetes bacterium]|nr:formylglycine-generating enzyme family protein [Planctomycetota bacterium]
MNLSSAGVISGTPTGAGTSSVTIQVKDAANQTAGRTFLLTVEAAEVEDMIRLTAKVSHQNNNAWELQIDASKPGRVQVQSSPDLAQWTPATEVVMSGLRENLTIPALAAETGKVFYRARRLYSGTEQPVNPAPDRLAWIPPGTFLMGSPSTEPGRYYDEGPRTEVTISRGFWMGKHEVTQREYQERMGTNPSSFTGDLDRPVEGVTWHDAVAFCVALTQAEQEAGRLPTGYEYRLPSEAQWEYACRAGTTTRFGFAETGADLAQYAWYSGNSNGMPHAVGRKLPNAWGLYDMHGNVWEWCGDRYATSYPGGTVTDPLGPDSGSSRVNRGGSWYNAAYNCRSALRFNDLPSRRYSDLGFRVALVSIP